MSFQVCQLLSQQQCAERQRSQSQEAENKLQNRTYCILSFIAVNWLLQADTSSQKIKNVLLSTSDTLIWQAFASIIVPGFTINRICAMVRFMQKGSTSVALKKPWISTLVGLVSIPIIIHPIDHAVERTMDVTYRKWTGYHPKALPYEMKHEWWSVTY